MSDDWRAINRAHWDERVLINLRLRPYDVESFKAGRRRAHLPSPPLIYTLHTVK